MCNRGKKFYSDFKPRPTQKKMPQKGGGRRTRWLFKSDANTRLNVFFARMGLNAVGYLDTA